MDHNGVREQNPLSTIQNTIQNTIRFNNEHIVYILMALRKSGQSYLLNQEGNITFNSALTDGHQALFTEFISEEQIVLDCYTAFDNDAIIQITVNPFYYPQEEVLDAYDEDSLFDGGAISKTVNVAYTVNRPYFFPMIATLDDYMWKVTRKLHKRIHQGQVQLITGNSTDRVLADSTTTGATNMEYLAKADIACVKGRH